MNDDFFHKVEATPWKFLKHSNKRLRIYSSELQLLEIVFIAICYKCSHFNNLKVLDLLRK